MQSNESSDTSVTQETPQINEELNFNNPDYTFTPSGHEWRQRGPYLICSQCELQHAVWIGTDKILTGFEDDGKPVIKSK